jgi:hypothetical protein
LLFYLLLRSGSNKSFYHRRVRCFVHSFIQIIPCVGGIEVMLYKALEFDIEFSSFGHRMASYMCDQKSCF